MKKGNIILCLAVSILSLSSCSVIDKRINIIVPGLFYCLEESNDEEISYYLTIQEIGEIEFEQANGFNVIRDWVNQLTYKIEFYSINRQNERYDYNFSNLHVLNTTPDWPIWYYDDNDFNFFPRIILGSYTIPFNEMEYALDNIREGKRFRVQVYGKEM